jgi:hypothetical protein
MLVVYGLQSLERPVFFGQQATAIATLYPKFYDSMVRTELGSNQADGAKLLEVRM